MPVKQVYRWGWNEQETNFICLSMPRKWAIPLLSTMYLLGRLFVEGWLGFTGVTRRSGVHITPPATCWFNIIWFGFRQVWGLFGASRILLQFRHFSNTRYVWRITIRWAAVIVCDDRGSQIGDHGDFAQTVVEYFFTTVQRILLYWSCRRGRSWGGSTCMRFQFRINWYQIEILGVVPRIGHVIICH